MVTMDYRLAFDLAPLGLALSRDRIMIDCNQALCEMFGADRDQLVGQSFQVLYPSADEFERMGERIASGAIRVGRTCNGCGHAQVWGAARASGAPLRRWGFHQIDNDLFRDSVCGGKWDDSFAGARPWVNFSRGDASPGEGSACEGGYLCAVEEGELHRCAGFKHDPPDPWYPPAG